MSCRTDITDLLPIFNKWLHTCACVWYFRMMLCYYQCCWNFTKILLWCIYELVRLLFCYVFLCIAKKPISVYCIDVMQGQRPVIVANCTLCLVCRVTWQNLMVCKSSAAQVNLEQYLLLVVATSTCCNMHLSLVIIVSEYYIIVIAFYCKQALYVSNTSTKPVCLKLIFTTVLHASHALLSRFCNAILIFTFWM